MDTGHRKCSTPGFLLKTHLALHASLYYVARSLVVGTARDEKLSGVTWEEIVSSADQIFHMRLRPR